MLKSCCKAISANWSLLNPKAAAAASCCILFPVAKDSIIAPLFANSSESPARSLFKANLLAFSRLISLPINNSASNSFLIELSKSNKLPAIASTVAKLAPNNLASAAALANSTGFLPNETAIAALTLLISSNIAFAFNATPFCFEIAPTVATVVSKKH